MLVVAAAAAAASAQQTAVLEGRLVNSLNGDPIAGATVVVDELKREAVSGPDGTFRFDNLAPGTYHVSVRAQGYSSRRTEVTVPAAGGAPVELRVDFDLHFQEVASVSAEARSQFDAFQPTTVLAGQELTKQLESSLGATLENQPGLASRSFGSGPVAAGHSRAGRRSRADSAGWPAHRRFVEPVGRPRRQPSIRHPPKPSKWFAGRPRCCTERMPSAVSSTSSPTRFRHGPFRARQGSRRSTSGLPRRKAARPGHVQLGNGKFAVNIGGGGRARMTSRRLRAKC